jgi:hypothetical protein
LSSYPVNIQAPSDDSPFFFNMVRPEKIFGKEVWTGTEAGLSNFGVFILDVLFLCVTFLTIACIVLPLFISSKGILKRRALPLVSYFCFVGVGFMLIEMAAMQKLGTFLGHPTYGLTVVLFSLLAGTGTGSYLSGRLKDGDAMIRTRVCICGSILALICFVTILICCPTWFHSAALAARICFSIACVLPMGIVMGLPFPQGMRLADSIGETKLLPWLWGINGASSVLASILAIILSMSLGICATLCIGVGFYMLALIMLFALATKNQA